MLTKILTAVDKFKNYEGYIAKHVKIRYGMVAPIAWANPGGIEAYAYILRGAWVVGCECGECVFYEPGKPFFCPNCLNAENGHRPRPVVMPVERSQIEVVLLQRPNPNNRNWLVGETVKQLNDENLIHLKKGG